MDLPSLRIGIIHTVIYYSLAALLSLAVYHVTDERYTVWISLFLFLLPLPLTGKYYLLDFRQLNARKWKLYLLHTIIIAGEVALLAWLFPL